MFDKLLPAIDDSFISDAGAFPVVFEGLEHILEKKVPNAVPSKHKTHELLYLRNGRIDYIVEGRTVSLEKGNTIILRPNVAHKVVVPSGTADTYVLYFGFSRGKENVIESMRETASPSLESFFEFAEGDKEEAPIEPYIILSGNYKSSISNIVERIVSEKKENDLSNELMLRLLTVELMVVLSRAMKKEWEETLRVRNGKARELVMIAKEYIDDNYDRGITVANAASYVFLSQGYFTRAFKDEFGMSPMNYLMKKRIEGACDLLANNEIKVSAVAQQAGFSSPQRFNVAFRKQMGITPMEYRKMKTKGE